MKYLVSVIMVLWTLCLSAQIDSMAAPVYLESVTIEDKMTPLVRQNFAAAQEQLSKQAGISELLHQQSTAYLKSYGSGSLATLALRGGSANQTQIQWEGTPINNPMLGIADLSLLTTGLFADIDLQAGGLSASEGSGAITGILDIGNKTLISQENSVQAQLSVGQFGQFGTQLTVQGSTKDFSLMAKAFYLEAENDFSYALGNGLTKLNSNATYQAKALLVNANLLSLSNQVLRFNIWLQETYRGIPPTTVQNSSIAFQDDLLKRFKVDYSVARAKDIFKSTIAYFDEHNDFSDPERLTEAANRFKTLWHSASYKHEQTQRQFGLKTELSHTNGFSKSYAASGNKLSRFALIGSGQQRLGKLRINGVLRKEWTNVKSSPLIPSLSMSLQTKRIKADLKLSREYRSPTLNELYWQPVGNLNLAPELGWNQELTLSTTPQPTTQLPHINTTFYHRKINNWILWIPVDGSTIWSPTNLSEVRSYGADINAQQEIKIGRQQIKLVSGYNYVRSENLTTINNHSIAKGDQLIYTPRHKAYFNWTQTYKSWSLGTQLNYTGQAKAINTTMPGYFLANATLIYNTNNHNSKKHQHQIKLILTNLFDNNYRVIERRAMPGRQVNINWTIKIKK